MLASIVTGMAIGFTAATLVFKVIAKKIVKCKARHEYDDAMTATQLATAPRFSDVVQQQTAVPSSTEDPFNKSDQRNRMELTYAYPIIQRQPQIDAINTKGNVSYVPS